MKSTLPTYPLSSMSEPVTSLDEVGPVAVSIVLLLKYTSVRIGHPTEIVLAGVFQEQ